MKLFHFSQIYSLIFYFLFTALLPFCVMATESQDEDEETSTDARKDVIFYRSPEERREAGLGHQLTDWLTMSGLLEVEREQIQYEIAPNSELTEKEPLTKNIQIALEVDIAESWEAEAVFEIEKADKSTSFIEEAFITKDWKSWSLSAGVMVPAFGEYFSHFIVGPMLEFGEIRGKGLNLDFSPSEQWQIGGFMLKSEVDQLKSAENFDWGLVTEWVNEDESIRAGLSYLSDLADTDEPVMESPPLGYRSRVDAVSAYLLIGFEQFEITTEAVSALTKFDELERGFQQPQAYNFEVAYFPLETVQLAIRYEISKHLEDAPDYRYGANIRWLILPNMSIAIEYLYGDKPNTPFELGEKDDDEDAEIEPIKLNENIFAFQLSIEF